MATSSPPDLRDLSLGELRRAAEIYLGVAYDGPDGAPEAVRRRLEWSGGVAAEALLEAPPFERANRLGGDRPAAYALRLGNAAYPHMKLQVQPWPNAAGFMLSVNTHDQVLAAVAPVADDADRYRALQAENQRYKDRIEAAWDAAGLPTFLRYLSDYLRDRDAAP